MQAADILSDLTSLRACDPAAAQALVSARPPQASSTRDFSSDSISDPKSQTREQDEEEEDKADAQDPDLQRAKALVRLHYEVKMAHEAGLGAEMLQARESVRRAVDGLGR